MRLHSASLALLLVLSALLGGALPAGASTGKRSRRLKESSPDPRPKRPKCEDDSTDFMATDDDESTSFVTIGDNPINLVTGPNEFHEHQAHLQAQYQELVAQSVDAWLEYSLGHTDPNR